MIKRKTNGSSCVIVKLIHKPHRKDNAFAMNTVTQTMKFRQSLLSYAEKHEVTQAAIKYNVNAKIPQTTSPATPQGAAAGLSSPTSILTAIESLSQCPLSDWSVAHVITHSLMFQHGQPSPISNSAYLQCLYSILYALLVFEPYHNTPSIYKMHNPSSSYP